jgi:peptide/nickel transport system substrate-binding protein
MTEDPNSESKAVSRWNKFQRLSVHRKDFRKRLRKAESVSQRHAHRFILRRLDSLRESRLEIIRWLSIVVIIIVGIGVQAHFFTVRSSAEAAQPGGTYVEGVVGKLENLNPLYASSSAETAVSRLVFSSLYRYDNTGHLHTDVASAVQVDEKGTSYTVKLRGDVMWHDGTKLTAQDVVYTVNTIKNPAARVRASLRANWVDISVKAIDDQTVQFTLPVGYAAFVHALTFPIVPRHLLSQITPGGLQEGAFSRSPVGSGPFVFKLLQSADTNGTIRENKAVHMIANPSYYLGKPQLNRFELNTYPSADSLVAAVRAHEVTGAADLSYADTTNIPSKEYTVQSYPLDNGVYLINNMTSEVMKDKAVRQAVQSGIDTAAVRRAAGGNVPALDLPFIAEQVGGSLPSRPAYDTKQATKYLEESGWKLDNGVRKKDGKQLTIKLVTTKTKQFDAAANEVAKQLQQLGIKVDVNAIDTANPTVNFVTQVLQPRDYDMLLYELPIGADPDVYAYWHSSQLGVAGYNFANYSNQISDATLSSARDRLDKPLRDTKYTLFAKQWLNDVPGVGLFQQVATYARSVDARAMKTNAKFVINSDRYANVIFWTASQFSVYKTP